MTVATMNIKDPEVRELAERLAAWRRTSMTDAVRQALAEALARERQQDPHYVTRLSDLARQVREASDAPLLTDDDLYDERGAPR